jgi:hypothetical protein
VSLVDQFQVQSHTIREEPFSAADDHRADDHLQLIDNTRPLVRAQRVQDHQPSGRVPNLP